jgi:hypothetical protein
VDYLTGSITSDPDCFSRGVNLINCVVRGSNNQRLMLIWNGMAWDYYHDLGGYLRSGPTIASSGALRNPWGRHFFRDHRKE